MKDPDSPQPSLGAGRFLKMIALCLAIAALWLAYSWTSSDPVERGEQRILRARNMLLDDPSLCDGQRFDEDGRRHALCAGDGLWCPPEGGIQDTNVCFDGERYFTRVTRGLMTTDGWYLSRRADRAAPASGWVAGQSLPNDRDDAPTLNEGWSLYFMQH